MSERVDKARAEQLLRDAGWSVLLPITQEAQRLGCVVFRSRVYTRSGDGDAQIQIYDFAAEPETIADYEEELTALTSPRGSRYALVRQVRQEDWGIIVTSPREDAPTVEKALEPQGHRQDILTYHPQLKRVLGGDYFHEVRGHWLKACLCTELRAIEMKERLDEARAAYAAARGWPDMLEEGLPGILAILTVPETEVQGLPSNEGKLVVVQLHIESPEPIVVAPVADGNELVAFSRQLLGCLGAVHRNGLRLNRDAGTCLHHEFLVRSGALTDPYFMIGGDDPSELRDRGVHDLWSALAIVCNMSAGHVDAALAAAFEGVRSYTAYASLERDVMALLEHSVSEYLGRRFESLPVLADAVYSRRGA